MSMMLEIVGTLFLAWLGFKTLQLGTFAVGSLAAGLYRILFAGRPGGEISAAAAARGKRPSRLAPVSCR